MFSSANLYLRQTAPTCRIASWSLNLSVERAMAHTRVVKDSYEPELFADTETAQFSPWPIHEHLAFGHDLIPTLIRSLEVTRRQKPCLQLLRTLEHVLSDPELCVEALRHNVLKALTTLVIRGNPDVKFWVLACIRVIVGNPQGKTTITAQRLIVRQICTNFSAPEEQVREMAFTILQRLSDNWFAIPTLQKFNCIELIMKTLFSEVGRETLNENRIACLLETLVNLIDFKDGVQKAIRYDLFNLSWLMTCGLRDVEEAMLKVFVRVANDEFGRLGIRYKKVGQQLLDSFIDSISEGVDPTSIGSILMLATLPNFERDDYQRMNAVEVVMNIMNEPNLSNPTKLVLLKLLTNLAELPEGRNIIKKYIQILISNQICNDDVREATAVLIRKTLQKP